MPELSNISTENAAAAGSPTDNTMMRGVPDKVVTSSSFSERVKNTLGNFFPFTMGTGTGDEVDTQEEKEDKDELEVDDFEFQVSLNSSTHENEASTNIKTGYLDRLGAVRTISKTIDGMQRLRDFMTRTKSEEQSGKDRKTRSGTKPAEPEAEYEETSRHRGKTRISTSTKLPGTNRVTPPLVTPLVDNGATLEEALTRMVDRMGEQSEQTSTKMSELEKAVHVERESLWDEIKHNRQKISRNEKCLIELSSRGDLGSVNTAESTEGYLKNKDAIRKNLTAV